MHRYRSHTCGALRDSNIGQTVRLSGWCHRIRDHGGVLFIDLRDHYGITQVVADPDSPAFKTAETLRGAVAPLEQKLTEASDYLIVGCAAVRTAKAGEKAEALCKDVNDIVAKALTSLKDWRAKPAALFESISNDLQKQLDLLIDAETKKLLDAAQQKVNEALRLPAGSAAKP